MSVRTIEGRKRRKFAEVMKRGRAKGRISVRRAQMRLVEAGNPTMIIWMAKQLLGQRDVTPVEVTGPSGGPVALSMEFFDSLLREHDGKVRKK